MPVSPGAFGPGEGPVRVEPGHEDIGNAGRGQHRLAGFVLAEGGRPLEVPGDGRRAVGEAGDGNAVVPVGSPRPPGAVQSAVRVVLGDEHVAQTRRNQRGLARLVLPEDSRSLEAAGDSQGTVREDSYPVRLVGVLPPGALGPSEGAVGVVPGHKQIVAAGRGQGRFARFALSERGRSGKIASDDDRAIGQDPGGRGVVVAHTPGVLGPDQAAPGRVPGDEDVDAPRGGQLRFADLAGAEGGYSPEIPSHDQRAVRQTDDGFSMLGVQASGALGPGQVALAADGQRRQECGQQS